MKYGLTSVEAQNRLNEYGENQLEEKSSISLWKIFFLQFKSIVMLLLIVASLASFFIGEIVEGVAVLGVILITAILGLIMEYKAGKSIEALQNTVNPQAKVIRDGEVTKISTTELVSGDLVVLDEGDQIPADGRLIKSQELALDESMLTGESEPVRKHSGESEEHQNRVYMGSSVLKGNGRFIVTDTGTDTEIGNISRMLKETKDEDTPLEKRLEQTGRTLILLTLVITGIVAIMGYLTGKPLEEMLKTSIALAIAAVPEGLPAAATITLAIGMNRMVKKKALVRNLPAVETLGSATILCTDKTGTLTENEMTLQKILIDDRVIDVSGTGYNPEGRFSENETRLDPINDSEIELILRAGILCSDATLKKNDTGEWGIIGDPTEGALVVSANKAGMNHKEMDESYPRRDVIPFDSARKYMAVHTETPNEQQLVFLKGAPEVVLEMCDYLFKENKSVELNDEKRSTIQCKNEDLANESFRVLALAYKEIERTDSIDLENEVKEGLVFIGLVGMVDPPREGVKESIEKASKAGIRTIMLTGDQLETAVGIAKKIGIENHDDFQGIKSIYARITPKDKLEIISALKNSNEIVAMTGDGVNDAPALKKADIGIAMGLRGTTVAKESSDMILLDDRYSTIVEAVRQGRVIFDNIQKFIHYLLSCNLSEILFIFLSIIVGVPVPLVALQILWLNVVTGVFPALAMAWEIPEEGVMEKPPRKPNSPIITNRYKILIGFQGLILAIGPFVSYLVSLSNGIDLIEARTIGFMTLAIVHLLQVFSVRRKTGLGFDQTVFKNPYLIGALLLTLVLQLIAVYVPFLQNILKTTAISQMMWGYVLIGAVIPTLILQIIATINQKKA